MMKLRLDEEMVRRGMAPSRSRARDSILRGCVSVDGRLAEKAGCTVAGTADIRIDDPALDWVSRAALKLIAALDRFGFEPGGKVCLDIGASTGGFTQVLLRRGALTVHAVDVGHGQLDSEIADNARVVSHEGLNAKDLTADHISTPVDMIVADVSFISLTQALPRALDLAAAGAVIVALVKPQYESGREAIGKGGIVRDTETAEAAPRRIADWLKARDWNVVGAFDSPIAGADGNREFLLGARRS